MTTTVPASMTAADVATQAELDTEKARIAALEAGTSLPAGVVVQVVATSTTAMTTGSTTVPADDTIPQSTEGNALAALDTTITPKSATNRLLVTLTLILSHGTDTASVLAMLFKDSETGARAMAAGTMAAAGAIYTVVVHYEMVAGSTSATTFKARYGSATAGTVTVNGVGGARFYGGVLTSRLEVVEVKA